MLTSGNDSRTAAKRGDLCALALTKTIVAREMLTLMTVHISRPHDSKAQPPRPSLAAAGCNSPRDSLLERALCRLAVNLANDCPFEIGNVAKAVIVAHEL